MTYYYEHYVGLAINGMSPPTVTWEGLRAWCDLMQIELEPWEARTLVLLGREQAVIESKAMSQQTRKPDGPRNKVRPD